VLALLDASTMFMTDLADGHPIRFYYPFIWEITGYYIAFALLPLYVLGFGRLPINRRNWHWAVPVHLAISVGFGIVHTLLMRVTREQLYSVLGLGAYNYGVMRYRFLMEYHKQFLAYWIVYAVLRVMAYYRQSREREREAAALELKTSELQRQLAQVQLGALRSQLNPHFFFNTLNMVSSVMYEDVARADHMIATLSRMLRMNLEEDVGAQVSLRRELEFVQCAVELIEARFQDRVAIDIQCAPEALDDHVPNMILHTLIENAIKHHNLERDSVIRIQARIRRTDTGLEIDVWDNGPGIADLRQAMNAGVGLSNTKARLAGLYGENYRFELENRPEGGLHVHLRIPVINSRPPDANSNALALPRDIRNLAPDQTV
jgi:sensor histidine kinase YesM